MYGANARGSLLRAASENGGSGESNGEDGAASDPSSPFNGYIQRAEMQKKAEDNLQHLLEQEKAMEAAAREKADEFKSSVARRYSTTSMGLPGNT